MKTKSQASPKAKGAAKSKQTQIPVHFVADQIEFDVINFTPHGWMKMPTEVRLDIASELEERSRIIRASIVRFGTN